MRTSLVSAVVLGLVSSALAVPAGHHGHGKPQYRPSPCTQGPPNTTDIQNVPVPSTFPTETPMSTTLNDFVPSIIPSKPADTPFISLPPPAGKATSTSVPPTVPTSLPESPEKGKGVTQPQDDPTDDFTASYVNLHNKYRSLHHAPALVYDADLAAFAKGWTKGCVMEHSGKHPENLCMGYKDIVSCITAWYDEGKDYDYNNGDFSHSTGHFTQVVWKSATKIGCAEMDCGAQGKMHSCNYDAGNLIGSFKENVLPE